LCGYNIFQFNIFTKKTGVNKYLIIAFILITIANYIDHRLKTNVEFLNLEKDLDKTLEESTTGDFLLFRSYHSYDIPELFFFRYFNSLYSKIFFGHIGMILKTKDETYIVENTEDEYFCLHHKYKKNGPILHKAKDKIKEYSGRVYLSKNNLHKFISESQIRENFKKYENYHFLQDGIGCVSMISNML
jgi:hypothetical protein